MAEKTESSKMSDSVTSVAQSLTEELLKKAQVDAKVEVLEEEETIKVNILGDDLGILIGFHGETLKALQVLLGVMINRQVGKETWYRVLVDVGSWRSSRQTSLEEMAKNAVEKVKTTGEPYPLPPLTPDERRLIHLYLQEEKGIKSQSEGEGTERQGVR
jgi:spoIIIJ-associated protein